MGTAQPPPERRPTRDANASEWGSSGEFLTWALRWIGDRTRERGIVRPKSMPVWVRAIITPYELTEKSLSLSQVIAAMYRGRFASACSTRPPPGREGPGRRARLLNVWKVAWPARSLA